MDPKTETGKVETKEFQEEENNFDVDFNVNFDEDEDDFIDEWKNEFTNSSPKETEEDQEDGEDLDFEGKEDDDNDDEINFDEDDPEELKLDIEAFNKKLNTNFKTQQELIDFMKSKDSEDKVPEVSDEEVIKDADLAIQYYSPLVTMNDKDLMRKQLETIAANKNKDINDEDVQYEIEEELQEMIDSYDLNNKASQLRDRLKMMITEAESKKKEVQDRSAQRQAEQEKERKENLQKAFIDINEKKKFFGVNVQPKRLTNVYKDVSTGKFLDKIQSDPKLLVELATMLEYREEISKKTSGRSYSDGVGDILKDYKSKKEDKSITKAQQRGSSGSSDNSKDLIQGFIS